MSRLDSFIRRLEAQRACLNEAARLIASHPGVVFELGLGNGRTYDHLREQLPGRRVLVFDRQIATHPDSTPPAEDLFIGDLRETLPQAARLFAGQVILAHCDTGSGDALATAALAAFLSQALLPALAPGALVLSDQPLSLPGATALPLPAGVPSGRYQFSRASAVKESPPSGPSAHRRS